MSAPQRGLAFRQARQAVELVAPLSTSPQLLDHAAQLLVSWWTAAAGHGVSSRQVPGLALLAVDGLALRDLDRNGVQL